MQKVVGSSPIIRSSEAPETGLFHDRSDVAKRVAIAPLLLAFVAGVAAGCSNAGRQPPVPLRVQQRLATLYPDAAFVPERLPPGYRYESWGRDVGLYDIAFVKGPADDVQREITFSVDSTPYVAPGLQGANPNDAFHIDGHTVYWVGGSHFDNSAWRWVRSGGRSLRITAANATARTDAILVGSARRVK